MKDERRQLIIELVKSNTIETQEELIDLLNQHGFPVTQATISRDIRALRLVKNHDENGRTHYVLSGSSGAGGVKFYALFADVGKSVRYAGNMLVIQCNPGTANAICASLDDMEWDSIVGTLAGDDTIFCVMESENEAKALCEKLGRLL